MLGRAELLRSRVHQHLTRSMIEGVRDHRLDDRDIIDDLAEVRQQFGNLGCRSAPYLRELELRVPAAWSSG